MIYTTLSAKKSIVYLNSHSTNASTILTQKNNLPAFLGHTSDEIRAKGIKVFSKKSQLIPASKIIPELSFEEAQEMLNKFNSSVLSGEQTLENYFRTATNVNDTLKTYVTTTDQQNQSVQGLMNATKAARAEQLSQNEAIRKSTLTARAGQIAFKALSASLNMLFMAGLSVAVSWLLKGMDSLVHSAENCRKRVNELMTTYKSTLNTANSNADTVEKMAEKYEELSRGVNGLGEIYSLAAKETEEYHSICNQIAEMFPDLVAGYTEEGDAILTLKGNVDQLRNAYKEAQQEAYTLLISGGKNSNSDDIVKNWKNLHNTGFFSMIFDPGADDVGGSLSTREALDQLKAVSEMTAEQYKNIVMTAYYGVSEDGQELSDSEKVLGFSHYLKKALDINADSTDEEFKSAIMKAKALAQTYQNEINSSLREIQTLANAYLMTNEDYAALDASAKNAASIVVNSISENIADGFDTSEDVGSYVASIVEIIKDSPGVKDAVSSLFSLDTSDMPLQEARKLIDLYASSIADALQEDEREFKTAFGFGGIDEAAHRLYNSVRLISDDHGTSDHREYALLAGYTERFTQSEAELWLTATRGAKNAEHAIQMYEDALAQADNLRPDWPGLTENQSKAIDDFQSRIGELTSALSSLQSGKNDPGSFTDLLQTFPELHDKTDNLDSAVQDLISTLLDDLYTTLGDGIPSSLKESLQSIADEARRTALDIKSLSDAFSDLKAVHDLQSALRQEISSGAVSASTLQRIIDQYPLMEDAVNAYCAGLLTEAGLYDLLSRQYAQDLDAFQETGRAKLYTSELFYSQCLDNNSDLVSQLAEEYGLDLRNFKNVQAAKLAGEQRLLGSMAGLWSQYYEVVLDKDGQYKIQGTPYSETYDVQNSSEYIAMEEESQKIQEYLDKLNKIFRLYNINSLEFSPGTMDSSPDSPDSAAADTEPFSEKRDWIEKLISATSSALDRLKDKISNTYLSWTLRNHSLAQSMQKTKEAIAAQQQACESYMREAAAVGLPREYIDKIQSGTLQLETVTDQALADRIREYETWHDKAARCSEAVEDLKNQLSELARQRFDNINTYFQGLMATTEKTIARLNARQNNTFKANDPSLYRKLRAQTQTLLDYNIQRAARLEEALDDAAGGGYLEAGSQAWRDMYNEILEVQNATEEYKNQLNELAQKEYDALLRPFENALTRLEQRKSLIDAMTLRLELQGHTASRGLYERQLREDQASLRSLTEQAEQLRRNMSDAAGKGMETGSDQWLEMRAALAENTSAAMELENNIQKLKNSIRELDWEKFDRLKDSLTPLDDEADFLLDLLDQDGLYDEDGSLNENGNAAAGLHTRNYYTQLELAGRYRTELDRITAELADDPYNTTLEQRQYELADACRAAARAASEEYRAVTDLARKGYQAQADALRKLTDARKELLDTEKSQYQYQKNLAEKTRNLSGIQKQLSALSGDDSEENKARIQKLSTDLDEARRDLEETTYDKWYSDQAELLDRLAEEYEELITRQTQEEQTLFQEMTASADANARQIQDTINAAARKWGYRPSDDLLSAWTTGQDGSADIAANTALQLRRLCELNEKLYRAAAALGDLGLTDYGLETTLTDETAARNFIGRLYQGLLHRQPDEDGMDFWLHRLTDGATVQDILEGFLGSPEYLALNKSPSDTILDFYQGLLGRQAEDAGYQHWMEQYHSGMTLGEIGTHGFLDSPEFLSDKMWLRLADAVPLIPALQSLPPVSPPRSGPSITFGDLHITIPIEHVNDYNDFVTQLQKDNKFERMVQDMTLGRALGQAGLAKNSYRF